MVNPGLMQEALTLTMGGQGLHSRRFGLDLRYASTGSREQGINVDRVDKVYKVYKGN